ncbi:MAG: hypothetical protein QF464_24260, partial [Myxococcota bacterium]|nr:hypothetical protein [Myxococcota bacterium]
MVEHDVTRWDASRRRVVAVRERCFMDLVLDSSPIPVSDRDAAAECLARYARASPHEALAPNAAAEQVIRRMALVARLVPEVGLPVDPWSWLVDRLPALCIGHSSFDALRALDLPRVLLD